MEQPGYVYIIADKGNSVINIEVTTNLKKRMWMYQRKTENIKLIYFEKCVTRSLAFTRARKLGQLSKQDKLDLVDKANSNWRDLTEELKMIV